MPKINLTGKQYGYLTVLGDSGERTSNGKTLWSCQCKCGKICLRQKDSLDRPSKKPKACSPQCQAGMFIGNKFERLTIINIIVQPNQETLYECECECGNLIKTTGYRLKSGSTKSCGCFRKERMSELGEKIAIPADIKGQKFGKLTALEPTEKRQGRSIIWKCQCECGNFHYASVSNLKGRSVTACVNCRPISNGEEEIKTLLEKMHIPFVTQQTFDSCRAPGTNALLRFDFFVDNKYLIEFDGKQHYIEVDFFKDSTLEERKIRDIYKNEWCKEHNISLIRIPYTKLSSITEEDLKLETSKYLIF